MAMSMPALIAMAMASFLSLATFSRCQRLLMSAQSVTIMPSQPSSSLSQPVSRRRLMCVGTPLMLDEFTIMVRAPLRRHSRNGAKCFSRRSASLITAGVRSWPLNGTP